MSNTKWHEHWSQFTNNLKIINITPSQCVSVCVRSRVHECMRFTWHRNLRMVSITSERFVKEGTFHAEKCMRACVRVFPCVRVNLFLTKSDSLSFIDNVTEQTGMLHWTKMRSDIYSCRAITPSQKLEHVCVISCNMIIVTVDECTEPFLKTSHRGYSLHSLNFSQWSVQYLSFSVV